MPSPEPDAEVLEANRAFYAAFEARDLEAMARVWECSERAVVTHPGWPTLRTWPAVAESWRRIFEHTPYIQFFLTDEAVVVAGDAAWVTLCENILQEVPGVRGVPGEAGVRGVPGEAGVRGVPGDEGGRQALGDARVAATNVFVRTAGTWRMVVHHGSPVGG